MGGKVGLLKGGEETIGDRPIDGTFFFDVAAHRPGADGANNHRSRMGKVEMNVRKLDQERFAPIIVGKEAFIGRNVQCFENCLLKKAGSQGKHPVLFVDESVGFFPALDGKPGIGLRLQLGILEPVNPGGK